MSLHDIPELELRAYCKRVIESLELWLRRLIDQQLTDAYGRDYLNARDEHGNNFIDAEIQRGIENRRAAETARYSRPIDAALLDDEIRIICNPQRYRLFCEALAGAFPDGVEEARTFLSRLIEPKNRLDHANTISIRDAERVMCYSNDVIHSLMKHYDATLGEGNGYNCPTIVRIIDSFGNDLRPDIWLITTFSLYHTPAHWLRPGDLLSIDVEIDPAFPENMYEISWTTGDVHEQPRELLPNLGPVLTCPVRPLSCSPTLVQS